MCGAVRKERLRKVMSDSLFFFFFFSGTDEQTRESEQIPLPALQGKYTMEIDKQNHGIFRFAR